MLHSSNIKYVISSFDDSIKNRFENNNHCDLSKMNDASYFIQCLKTGRPVISLPNVLLKNAINFLFQMLQIKLNDSIQLLSKNQLIMLFYNEISFLSKKNQNTDISLLLQQVQNNKDFIYERQPEFSRIIRDVLIYQKFDVDIPPVFDLYSQFKLITRHQIDPKQLVNSGQRQIFESLSQVSEAYYFSFNKRKIAFDINTGMMQLNINVTKHIINFIDKLFGLEYGIFVSQLSQKFKISTEKCQNMQNLFLISENKQIQMINHFEKYCQQNRKEALTQLEASIRNPKSLLFILDHRLSLRFYVKIPENLTGKQLQQAILVTTLFHESEVLVSIKALIVATLRCLMWYKIHCLDNQLNYVRFTETNWVEVTEIDVKPDQQRFSKYCEEYGKEFEIEFNHYVNYFINTQYRKFSGIDLLKHQLFLDCQRFQVDDIEQDSIQISFVDQYSQKFIEIPTRGSLCEHYQVFDGTVQDWLCQICGQPVEQKVTDSLLKNVFDYLSKDGKQIQSIQIASQFLQIKNVKYISDTQDEGTDSWFEQSQ